MHRKIELQSPADFTYLYANAVAVSRQKLDLHLPPSANANDGPDPMRERVRELVDEFITRTFTSASSSISINGLDSSSSQFPFPASFTAPTETIEYEPYDTVLASRVTALYAQLESLTTTVAQARRDAPRRAAKIYTEQLKKALEEDEQELGEEDEDFDHPKGAGENMTDKQGAEKLEPDVVVPSTGDGDVAMPDADQQSKKRSLDDKLTSGPSRRKSRKAQWDLQVPLGTEREAERWRNGEVAEVYEDALRTLLRLQGEAVPGDSADSTAHEESAADGNALASTVGKTERAIQAVDVVEKV
ncbi:hypothetical protein EYZ11_003736 [Aspergillus tanneri]|uniref:Kinetochore protein mis14 n=1 Tax=Aspergillus tanneri TaxID=1220188 RepID=A0A4S3JT49_9EURO|nr:uncharacterized protein ATNIH1004_007518 [Aspergillus tanneri]KAA8646095.1 hypothetical protein ATNIH1004_007518 [Aspergillus tanneri]THC96771.1 hypothetical protein EYZ11_003736 [Aspergillus tanneri]